MNHLVFRRLTALCSLLLCMLGLLSAETWRLVTSADQLEDGDIITIVSGDNGNVIGAYYNDGFGSVAGFSATDGVANALPDGATSFTLKSSSSSGYWLLSNALNQNVSYWGNSVELCWSGYDYDYSRWTINVDANAVATIQNKYYSDRYIRASSSAFKAYSILSYNPVRIYKKHVPEIRFEDSEYYVSAGAHVVAPVATGNCPITYQVEEGGESIVTVDPSTGNITLSGNLGDATITARATSAEDGDVSAGYTLHVVAPQRLTVSAADWATFAPSQIVELPAECYGDDPAVDVYYFAENEMDNAIVGTSDVTAIISSGMTLASATGLLIHAAAGEYIFPVNTTVLPTPLTGNMLVGVLESTGRPGDDAYIFKNGSEGIGFYPWQTGNLAAGKCYLQLAVQHGAPAFIDLNDVCSETDDSDNSDDVAESDLSGITTMYENSAAFTETQPIKFLHQGQLYFRLEDGLYTITGRQIK
ncbi:MAG: hypothetical protein MJZ89_00905 [Paludibacteraceae bacterium]|nr:hypothetical protein [Paludibacteraceae bacterium]